MAATLTRSRGQRLKAELVRSGLSQRQVADRLGVTPAHLNGILNGREPLTDQMAHRISAVTGISLRQILG